MKTIFTIVRALTGLLLIAATGCDNSPPPSNVLGSLASAAEAKEVGSAPIEEDSHALEVARLVVKAETSRDQSDTLVGITGVTLNAVVAEALTTVRKEDVLTKLELVLRRNNVPIVTNGVVLTVEVFGTLVGVTNSLGTKVMDFGYCTCSLTGNRFVLCQMPTKYVYIQAPVWRSMLHTLHADSDVLKGRVMNAVEQLAEEFAVSYLRVNSKPAPPN